MNFFETYGKELVSAAVPVVIWLLNRLSRSGPRIEIAEPHDFMFLVPEPLLDPNGNQLKPTQTVHTRSITIRNSGNEPAHNVELIFNWKPQFLNVWPPRNVEEVAKDDGRHIVRMETLSPNEVIAFEILSINQDLPVLVNTRSDESVPRIVRLSPQPIVTAGRRRFEILLMTIGSAATVYLLIQLIQFLVLRTPGGS